MKKVIYLLAGLLLAGIACSPGAERSTENSKKSWKKLPVPEVGEKWVQPVQGEPVQPVWGHANGMRIGISPMPGPLIKDENGTAYFIAAPNEEHPQDAEYADDTKDHWKYYADKATQYWYQKDPGEELQGLVNGRYVCWGSKSPIPGGISYENFELKEPFPNGSQYVFGVSPLAPEEIIEGLKTDDF